MGRAAIDGVAGDGRAGIVAAGMRPAVDQQAGERPGARSRRLLQPVVRDGAAQAAAQHELHVRVVAEQIAADRRRRRRRSPSARPPTWRGRSCVPLPARHCARTGTRPPRHPPPRRCSRRHRGRRCRGSSRRGAVTAMPPMDGRPGPLQAAVSSRAGSALPPSITRWSSTAAGPATVMARCAGPPAAGRRKASDRALRPRIAAWPAPPAVVSVTRRRSDSGCVRTRSGPAARQRRPGRQRVQAVLQLHRRAGRRSGRHPPAHAAGRCRRPAHAAGPAPAARAGAGSCGYLAAAIALTITASAAALSAQPVTFTHLPGSRSL